MKNIKSFWILTVMVIVSACSGNESQNTQSAKLRVLILDGSNNHYIWPKTTIMMKNYFEQTGLFDVEINRADSIWLGVKYNKNRPVPLDGYIAEFSLDSSAYVISDKPVKTSHFDIDFSQYDLIVSNLGAGTPHWPEATKVKFEKYMKNGGGLVVVHAANNAWGDWNEYNKMIGLGAWGGRDSLTGPYAYYDDEDNLQVDPSEGQCATHGREYEYLITTREPEHPIMKGLPLDWLHTPDEMYDRMRGPFKNTTILATAYSDVEKNEQPWEPRFDGTGWHVPTLMAINYGQGRVFHSVIGHFDFSMECVGFITILQRGAEWAATGKVTQAIPKDFPSKEKSVSRTFK